VQKYIELCDELEDKPSKLKLYEDKLRKVAFNFKLVEGHSSKGKHSSAK